LAGDAVVVLGDGVSVGDGLVLEVNMQCLLPICENPNL
jgi:hypothetical protein